MMPIRNAVLGSIGAIALTGALALPVTASAAAASQAGQTRQPGQTATNTFVIINRNGYAIQVNSDGDVTLGNPSEFTIADETYNSHHVVYYEYKDTATGRCIQADSDNQFMVTGLCARVNRQFWHWDGTVMSNLAFNSEAYAGGDYNGAPVLMGFRSGDDSRYVWNITDEP